MSDEQTPEKKEPELFYAEEWTDPESVRIKAQWALYGRAFDMDLPIVFMLLPELDKDGKPKLQRIEYINEEGRLKEQSDNEGTEL